jgi:hypothetical protein
VKLKVWQIVHVSPPSPLDPNATTVQYTDHGAPARNRHQREDLEHQQTIADTLKREHGTSDRRS